MLLLPGRSDLLKETERAKYGLIFVLSHSCSPLSPPFALFDLRATKITEAPQLGSDKKGVKQIVFYELKYYLVKG